MVQMEEEIEGCFWLSYSGSFKPSSCSFWSRSMSCRRKPLLGKIQRFCCTQRIEDNRLR